jgi:prepilin-type N-terminal cleavage/methylation domain-containing protein
MANAPAGRPRARGFTYIETLVALAILSLTLLLGVDGFLQYARATRRMESERQAFRALESTLEAVRAGTMPLASTWLEGFTTAVGNPAPPDLKVWMQVDPTGIPHLVSIHLQGTYRVDGKLYTKDLYSMVFRP